MAFRGTVTLPPPVPHMCLLPSATPHLSRRTPCPCRQAMGPGPGEPAGLHRAAVPLLLRPQAPPGRARRRHQGGGGVGAVPRGPAVAAGGGVHLAPVVRPLPILLHLRRRHILEITELYLHRKATFGNPLKFPTPKCPFLRGHKFSEHIFETKKDLDQISEGNPANKGLTLGYTYII